MRGQTGLRPDVVISNPSSNQEVAQAAAALAEAERLSRYHAPVAIRRGSGLERALDLIPGRIGHSLRREVARRAPPPGVAQTAVATATGSDLARVASTRLGFNADRQARLAEAHRLRFDRRVARALDPASDGTVVVVQGSGLATLQRARRLGIHAVLDATLPHPRTIAGLLADEVRRRPHEATELHGDRLTETMIRRREEEIATADRILVLSSFARDTYVEAGVPPEKLRVTLLGVDSDLFSPGRAPHSEERPFQVLFVGRISQAKGVGYLVEAFERAAIESAELVLVGDLAASRPDWLDAAGVRHLAPMPRTQLPDVYRGATVLVLPSLAESFGLVAIEAMACGVPVILSENSVGREAVSDGVEGWVVPIRDPARIAECISILASDPGLSARMGAEARRRARTLTWEAYRGRVLEALD